MRALFRALQIICGTTISTSGTAEVRVGRGKGQGKPEAKVNPYAWWQSLGQASPDGHKEPQHKSLNWAAVKIRARAQSCHSLPSATRLTPVLVVPGLVLARSGNTTEQEAEPAEPVLAGKERQGHRDPLNSSEPEAEGKKKKLPL